MSLSLAEYQRTIAIWRSKYGVPPPPKTYGLRVEGSHACVKKKCGSLKRTQRHHKGNDFWFACLFPDAFAARYIQFHPDDVAYVCEHHHKAVHKIYKLLMAQVYAEKDAGFISEERAREWMKVFRNAFDKWARYPAKKRKGKRKRRSLAAKHERNK